MEKKRNRRDFLQTTLRVATALSLGSIGGYLAHRTISRGMVWQIDPSKCVQCGRCADHCVKAVSAVKCVHAYDVCGYCDLCGGYFIPNVKNLNTGAENQLCPTKALNRKFVEEPYFEYEIVEELCIGCGKCVKGCSSFGNGSLHLQIRHDLCDNCNQCAIAQVCPAGAISRVSSDKPYLFKGDQAQNQ